MRVTHPVFILILFVIFVSVGSAQQKSQLTTHIEEFPMCNFTQGDVKVGINTYIVRMIFTKNTSSFEVS